MAESPSEPRAAIWAERSVLLATALSARAVLFAEALGLVRKAVKINKQKHCNTFKKLL